MGPVNRMLTVLIGQQQKGFWYPDLSLAYADTYHFDLHPQQTTISVPTSLSLSLQGEV